MRGATAILTGLPMDSATGTATQQTATTTEGIALLWLPRATTRRQMKGAQRYLNFLAMVSATVSSTPKRAGAIWATAKLQHRAIHTSIRHLEWVGSTPRMLV